jgi:hypothetical protein
MKAFLLALLLSLSQQQQKQWGQVVTSDHGRVDMNPAEAGTTVYAGDELSTPERGSIRVRPKNGCVQLILLSASDVELEEQPLAAKLKYGIVTFTATKKCFKLIAGALAVQPKKEKEEEEGGKPVIAQVIYVKPDEEVVIIAKQGSLLASVDGEEKIINEGECYRVLLKGEVPVQQEAEKPYTGPGIPSNGGPKKAGMSHFLITSMIFIGLATGFAISEALESPSRP